MPQISFEFFPPQTPRGRVNLVRTAKVLERFQPAFYSVTYGAGGSTRERTFAAVASLRESGVNAIPHLSWSGDREDAIVALLDDYLELGVDRVVALRGDLPSGAGTSRQLRHADSLVRLIRSRIDAPLGIEVAAYPEVHPDAPSASTDIDFLKGKIEAGATGCITQYFYNAEAYFHFRDRCAAAGIDVPIVPGVMPISNYETLVRFSAKAGVDIPRWIQRHLDEIQGDRDALLAFGTEVVSRLCRRLLDDGAPGLHFYTLNKAPPTRAIAERIGLPFPTG
ncbi:MAG: methylenetetrahydrofolate reductase [NAD(P)H] [Gammaproteobacteria bacterium]|nr:methylenetetrahydrofolate reductase [NAD(P)H] [Gammaproteobacteria bacterium]MYF28649.1 methylenetetrahydrofolate reductase [NAD(P)H] [Gammaproteobacteria bacterium]MYK45002.1 methylenetetrahydrofolate reductase [NAD(P)H] [Gammaproteobacteria bacterium]